MTIIFQGQLTLTSMFSDIFSLWFVLTTKRCGVCLEQKLYLWSYFQNNAFHKENVEKNSFTKMQFFVHFVQLQDAIHSAELVFSELEFSTWDLRDLLCCSRGAQKCEVERRF